MTALLFTVLIPATLFLFNSPDWLVAGAAFLGIVAYLSYVVSGIEAPRAYDGYRDNIWEA